ncbi:NADH-quinone oxidoreductase subunit C [Streptomyces sp. NPDC092370]|uniref:NADH-quinone oxidoreductase subunit C n=1 Tax=Streptomyces sp. NPDC092370 TaxID=3366016 RepID=UPI00382EAAC2
MTAVGWLPTDAEELFGPDATAEESYEVLTVDVPPAAWIAALRTARDRLGCTYFDWLSAVDEPGTGFRVTAHVAALTPVRRLLLRTTVPHETPALPSAVDVYAGAAWHERETHEMFGITFEGHPGLDHLLLPENFEGHPLRKDFVLAARVAKAWPGAKEPGESEHGGPKRRQMLPPGVPDPNEWGPLKGQLPPAPARPARGAGRAAGERPARAAARPAGERPARRTRSASEGSASQSGAAETATPASSPRRTGTAAEGSAGQSGAAETATPASSPRRTRTAAEGSASQSASGDATAPASVGPSAAGEPVARGAAGQSASGDATAPASVGPSAAGEPVAQGAAGQPTPQVPGGTGQPPSGGSAAPASARPRRNRSASEGSASQQPTGPAAASPGPESASPGPESATPHPESAAPHPESASPGPDSGTPGPEGGGSRRGAPGRGDSRPGRASSPSRSSDAPWHHARPAFDEPAPGPSPETGQLPSPEQPDGSQASGPTDDDTKPTGNPGNPQSPEDPAGGSQ